MSEHRNTSPYSQRRAQTYDTHAAGSSGDPYDGVEVSEGNPKQTMANRAQSLRHSSKCCHVLSGREESRSANMNKVFSHISADDQIQQMVRSCLKNLIHQCLLSHLMTL